MKTDIAVDRWLSDVEVVVFISTICNCIKYLPNGKKQSISAEECRKVSK
ncbi:MAG: hypothetical protein ACK6AZ_04870 [Pseudanabaena sp.]